jgi:hypothetical protein
LFLEARGQVYARQHGIQVLAVRLGWCPRPGQEEEFRQSDLGPDVYLSPNDAGRFFVAAVTAFLVVQGFLGIVGWFLATIVLTPVIIVGKRKIAARATTTLDAR